MHDCSKDKYYNLTNNHAISDENYEHFLNVWKAFPMNTMKYYHDLYLKVDVLLLVCLFKTFGELSINCFELDPVHCLSIPDYSWDVMLRFTNGNLKLISDTEKYQFVSLLPPVLKSPIRGGISMIY